MPEVTRSVYGWSLRRIKYPAWSKWAWGFAIGPWIIAKAKADESGLTDG